MKGILKNLYNMMEGDQLLTVQITDGDASVWMQEYGDREVEISVTNSKKRSKDANAYAWVLIGKLAAKTRQKKEDVYRKIIRDIGNNYEVVKISVEAIEAFERLWRKDHIGRFVEIMDIENGMAQLFVYYGSSDYDTKQMTAFIDSIIDDCKEQGIETMTPRERAELLRMWSERYGTRIS